MGSVVLIITGGIAPLIGGAESLSRNVASGLARRCETHLLTRNEPDPDVRAAVEGSGGSVTLVHREDVPLAVEWEHDAFYRAEAIYERVTASNPDLILAMSHDAALSTSIALGGGPKQPWVVACFSELATEMFDVGRRRSSFVYGLPRLDLLIALSSRYRHMALDYGVQADKIILNPFGVDLAHFSQGDPSVGRRLFGLPQGSRLVLCPSRFTPRKGQLDLLEAWSDRPAAWSDAHLVFCGTRNESDPGFQREIESRAVALGAVIRDDVSLAQMPHAMAAAEVVVQPSHYEGLGFSALEAFAQGKPTILTDIEGFRDFTRDRVNTVLAQPKSPPSLVEAMEFLANDLGPSSALGFEARETVRRRYDLDANLDQLLRRLSLTA